MTFRVAVIGAGPSGFYVVQALLQTKDLDVSIDLFDRLPAPYGLVRYGVAPDHPNIKAVTKVYDRLAQDERVRFFGGVEIGIDLTIEDLRRHYGAVAFCTGAQTDRRLGIPGEDLVGSHPATDFVAWYNGHPDFADCRFDLSGECAVVVGMGNVALDVARILVRTPEELEKTDIAAHALEALRASKIREVVVLGRRGPAQAAFTNKELDELGKMAGADARVPPAEVELDPLSGEDVASSDDKQLLKRVEGIQALAPTPDDPKAKTLWIRFLVSPTAIEGDASGRVRSVEIVHNVLERKPDGSLRPRAGEKHETVETSLVFRSVGYRGVPIPDVPFREDWGTIPHEAGRVEAGLYTAGWIKRGPSGVIGTNRPDAQETVRSMMEDREAGRLIEGDGDIAALLGARGVRWVDFPGWLRADQVERERGEAAGRPREKLVSMDALFDAAGVEGPDGPV